MRPKQDYRITCVSEFEDVLAKELKITNFFSKNYTSLEESRKNFMKEFYKAFDVRISEEIEDD